MTVACLQGVCDSAQGFVNCILFCGFTRTVRERLWGSLTKCCTVWRKCRTYKAIESVHEDTTCLVSSMNGVRSYDVTELLESSSGGYGTQFRNASINV